MADRNLKRVAAIFFGIQLVLYNRAFADSNAENHHTSIEDVHLHIDHLITDGQILCTILDHFTDGQEHSDKNGQNASNFRSRVEHGGLPPEMKYACRAGNGGKKNESLNVYDDQEISFEVPTSLLRKRKMKKGKPISILQNPLSITISCIPVYKEINHTQNMKNGEGSQSESSELKDTMQDSRAKNRPKSTWEAEFRCSGDRKHHISVIASMYVSRLQYENRHRKRAENRLILEVKNTRADRKYLGGEGVVCAPLPFTVAPGPTAGSGSGGLQGRENKRGQAVINRSDVKKSEGNFTQDVSFSCKSKMSPIYIRIRENFYGGLNGTKMEEKTIFKNIIICPSTQDIYANEWHSLLKERNSRRGKGRLKRWPKYNLKYFKLFDTQRETQMLCHLSKNHFSSIKTRRKRSIKGLLPQMIYTFLEQAVQPGVQISLKCSASGDPPPRFEWMLDSQILSPSSHRYMIGQYVDHAGIVITHLNITGVRVEDGGLYECRSTNSKGQSSHVARLNVYGPPYIRSISSVRGITGSDLTILCPYYGYPISFVKWDTSRFELNAEPRYIQSVDGSSLKILRLNPSKDSGTLTCSVGSPGGELAKREIHLAINSPPVLSPLSYPPDLKSGERAQLSCTVISGDMPVYFSWQKDGSPIASVLQIEERSTEFFSYLLFKSLSADHSGTYTCTSSNTAGKVNKSTEFVIKVPPYWSNEPQDLFTLLGSSVMMNCEARGHPAPRTYWAKSYSKEEYDAITSTSEHLKVFSNGSVLINSVTTQDKGRYRCTADNGVGSQLIKSIFLDVNEPARFDESSQNISVRRNDPTTLVCDIQGDNPIKNIWTHNTNSIDKTSYRLSISELKKEKGLRSQLSIERADRQDSGLYRCQASNSYGRSEHFIHLAVQERPDPPRQMEVIQVGSRSVRLSWQRPFDGNSPVLGYLLQHQVLRSGISNSWDSSNVVNVTIAVTSKQSTIGDVSDTMEQGVVNGLLPDTTYTMRMLAVNQIESSPYSKSIMAKTQEEAPTEPPQNVQVQAGEGGELIVTWQPPPSASWHGPLLGYTVHWAEVTEADSSGQQTPLTSSATVKGSSAARFPISGLGQFTKYRITVTAANRAGSGPASIPILGSTKEGVPTAPPQSVRCSALSSQSLKIEWAAPPRSRLGGNLLGYKILYKPLTDIYLEESGTAAEVKRTSSSETYLHALLKYANYSIQVLAYTGAGDGILSPAVFCTTEEDIPGQPADIKAMALTADSILVSWLPPKKPNGKIVFFTLYYREVGGGQPTSRQVSATEASAMGGTGLGGAVEVRGLLEKKRYEFWLSASTGAGEGAAISPVTQVTSARAGARIASFSGVIPSGVGRSLLLGCLAVGNPTPRARWLHTQRPITHSHLYQVTVEGNLLIHSKNTKYSGNQFITAMNMDKTVSGNYTCSAKNLFGSEEITYSVICLLPPGPPSLQLLYTTASSAQLQWSPNSSDGGSSILGYTLSFRRNEESFQTIDLSSEITSYKVIGLKCGSRYTIHIASHNRVGKGDPSPVINVNTKGEAPKFPEDWSAFTWSNATCIVVEIRRALGGPEGSICPLLSLGAEWRRGEGGTWRATAVSVSEPLTLTALSPQQWFEIRLAAENHAGRSETVLRASTTTLSGATISPPAYYPMQPAHPHEIEASQENIFNLISIILATIAAFSTLSVVYLLIRKRSVICHCNNESEYGVERQRSQSQASDEKTICAEQQNLRNSQHDYSTSPKGHAEKMRRETEDMYEISPYATFQVGGPHRPAVASTLDHTLQFRTFGHMENESPPLQAPCRRHFPQKSHRHDNSKGDDGIDSGCELLQPLRMRGRHRQGSGPSYCVPMAGQGEGFQAVLHINKNDIC